MTQDRLNHAREQGQLKFDSIREMVDAYAVAEDDWRAEEAALQAIHDSPLSVLVREAWHTPGSKASQPVEYQIFPCADVRIVGLLSYDCEPTTAWMEVQDWGSTWAAFYPEGVKPSEVDKILLDYARHFYFGE